MTALLLISVGVNALTFSVTNVNDAGANSLRQAILDANALQVYNQQACPQHTITFAIPGSGVHTIQPLTPLPAFQIPIVLDGYSQAGSSFNSLSQGDDAVITIELDGSLTSGNGIEVAAFVAGVGGICGGGGSQIDGLVINRFSGAGIQANNGGLRIYGNFIGTDTTGLIARGNGAGIVFQQNVANQNQGYTIVGEEIHVNGGAMYPTELTRNIISGNAQDGIYTGSSDPNHHKTINYRIRGNYIGLAANGTTVLGNGRHGVFADVGSSSMHIEENLIAGQLGDGIRVADDTGGDGTVSGNGIGIGVGNVALGNAGNGIRIGGTTVGLFAGGRYPYSILGNILPSIANNGGAGILIEDVALVDALGASVGDNTGLAIDIAPLGVNPNDAMDPDTGPNELLNRPIIASALFDPTTSSGTLAGTLNSTPNSQIEVHFFLNNNCDTSGFGGGADFLRNGQIPVFANVTTDALGNGSFSVPAPYLPVDKYITALSRRFSTVSVNPALIVSEFSACKRVVIDKIFVSGFEGP